MTDEERGYINNEIIVTRIAIAALERDYEAERRRLADKLQELEERI